MALSIGGGKNKSKTNQTQQFNEQSSTSLSPRAFGMLNQRMEDLGQRQYRELDPESVQRFMNPYQRDVVDATKNDLFAERERARAGLQSELAAGNAFGEDRRGVIEANLEGQQDRTLATTLAALNSRGYSEAQGVAAGENQAFNQYDQNTQQMLNQLLAILGNETVTNSSGRSTGTSRTKGSNLGFGFSYGGG